MQEWIEIEETFSVGRQFSDDEKVALVGTYLTGTPKSHWQLWRKQKLENSPDSPKTIDDFFRILRRHYTSVDAKRNRRRRFDTMAQTGSAQDFIFKLLNLRNLLKPILSDENVICRIILSYKDRVTR